MSHPGISTEIERELLAMLLRARIKLTLLATLSERVGWAKVREMLGDTRLPTVRNCRRGAFGEALLGSILEHFNGFEIPVWKDHFTITGNQALPAVDGIALRIVASRVVEVCYYESKLRTVRDAAAGVDAYTQIVSELQTGAPPLAQFVLARLEDSGDSRFAAFFDYLSLRDSGDTVETGCVGLTWEPATWDSATLASLSDRSSVGGLSLLVVVALVDGVGDLSTRLYAQLGVTSLVEDD